MGCSGLDGALGVVQSVLSRHKSLFKRSWFCILGNHTSPQQLLKQVVQVQSCAGGSKHVVYFLFYAKKNQLNSACLMFVLLIFEVLDRNDKKTKSLLSWIHVKGWNWVETLDLDEMANGSIRES